MLETIQSAILLTFMEPRTPFNSSRTQSPTSELGPRPFPRTAEVFFIGATPKPNGGGDLHSIASRRFKKVALSDMLEIRAEVPLVHRFLDQCRGGSPKNFSPRWNGYVGIIKPAKCRDVKPPSATVLSLAIQIFQRLPVSLPLHFLQFSMNAVSEMAPMPLARCEKNLGLLRGFGVDAPLFDARDDHGGMKSF